MIRSVNSGEWSQVEDYVREKMGREGIAGAAIAVSRRGEIVYEQGFGVRDLETGEPVTPDTIFGIASVTKSFTALAVMQLAEQGKLSIDDPVTAYLPEFALSTLEQPELVRIHHLLSHTTGLAPIQRREDLTRLSDHLAYVAQDHELLGLPGEYFSYCNDTFLLLGLIIERVTGRLFRRHMTAELLDRLEMNRSTFSLEEVARMSNVSVPYVKNADGSGLLKAAWPLLGNYEVGGGIRSNVRDLLTYGQLYTNGGSARGERILSEEWIRRMWQPVHPIVRKTSYGYGLKSTPDYAGAGVTLVEHGGGQPGVSSHFGFVPEEGIAAVVLTNVAHVPARDLWLAAIHRELGLPLDLREQEPEYEAASDELERFIGTYACEEGGRLSVTRASDGLRAELAGEVHPLRASDSRTLVMMSEGMPLPFFWKEGEKAWAVLLGSRMLTRKEEEGIEK
ncbi:serine hydrolase domain-containing protein [Brevibacillus composti]|uniref:serine hydrolase domain-containing protein n=1 Tax=Brevibacillus composti TaxID=2796470 RepID=UPI001E55C194|nr:serine hydrolase domain-containing protein [Brevibacillus composti]